MVAIGRSGDLVLAVGGLDPGHLVPTDEGGIAQVVCHHDRRVQRRKVERRNGFAIEALCEREGVCVCMFSVYVCMCTACVYVCLVCVCVCMYL